MKTNLLDKIYSASQQMTHFLGVSEKAAYEITIEKFKEELTLKTAQKILLIDVRTLPERNEIKIEYTKLQTDRSLTEIHVDIPRDAFKNPALLAPYLDAIPKQTDALTVIYCRAASRSYDVVRYLIDCKGFSPASTKSLAGGMLAWSELHPHHLLEKRPA